MMKERQILMPTWTVITSHHMIYDKNQMRLITQLVEFQFLNLMCIISIAHHGFFYWAFNKLYLP